MEQRTEIGCAQAARLLEGWDDILVLSHRNPDGDTLGCAAALIRGLTRLGKRVSFACADRPGKKLAPLVEGLSVEGFAPRHVVTVDVADIDLLGSLKESYEGRIDLAIDHHAGHRPFAAARWVEGDSAAAAEMIWLLLEELGVELDAKMAEAVYTGIATDTGCFRYRNTTPRSHRIAAQAMEHGADAAEINRLQFEQKSRGQFLAEQIELSDLEFFCEDRCTLVREPLSVLARSGAKPEELDGAVAAMARQIEGVLVGVMLKEREGEIKVSLRANPPVNASEICEKFGGGGHAGAAGCSFPGATMEQAAERMKAACEEYLRERALL